MLTLDVQIPGMRGPNTVQELRALGPQIVLFTLQPPEGLVPQLIAAGARGYVPKSSPVSELVDVALRVARGERVVPSELRSSATQPCVTSSLTERELEVFRRIARGDTPKEMAYGLGISASTVYTHQERLRKKLGASSIAELIRLAALWHVDHGSDD